MGHFTELGMLAQDRGDYPAAEASYRQALTIDEGLGNQAGMATTWSQLGLLRTAQNKLLDAVPFHVQALAVRLSIGVPQARTDVRALLDLRTSLGPEVFTETLVAAVGSDNVRRHPEIYLCAYQPYSDPTRKMKRKVRAALTGPCSARSRVRLNRSTYPTSISSMRNGQARRRTRLTFRRGESGRVPH